MRSLCYLHMCLQTTWIKGHRLQSLSAFLCFMYLSLTDCAVVDCTNGNGEHLLKIGDTIANRRELQCLIPGQKIDEKVIPKTFISTIMHCVSL